MADVLSLNNPEFENKLGQMYPNKLAVKDTTESNNSASYLDLLLPIGREGKRYSFMYNIRDHFNFHMTNFPFLSSNIPALPDCIVWVGSRYAPRMDVLF